MSHVRPTTSRVQSATWSQVGCENHGPEPTPHHSRRFSSVIAAAAFAARCAAVCNPPAKHVRVIRSNGFTAKQATHFRKACCDPCQLLQQQFQISFHWFDISLENVVLDAWAPLKWRSQLDDGETFQIGSPGTQPLGDSVIPLPLWLGSLHAARRSVLPLLRRRCAFLPRKQTVSKTSKRLAANECW